VCLQKVIGWTEAAGPLQTFGLGVVEDLDVNGELLALARDENGVTHLEATIVAIIETGMRRGGAPKALVQLLVHQSNKKGLDHPTLPAPVLLLFVIRRMSGFTV